ncbi:MAG: hypothetical protein HFE66_03070 [Clostridiales bacterium]|jgi:hypothetical protein|nr:hypothetical protein [Clostridiales bacterium]
MKNKQQREEAIPFDGTMPAGTPISEKKPKTKKRKKIVIVCIALVLSLLGAGGWYILYGNPNLLSQTFQDIRQHIVGMYGSQQSYIYYPIDYELDITTVKGYMELDRDIHYKDGAETVMITNANLDFYGPDVQFFKRYFDYAINGDYAAYNQLFTEYYYETNEPYYSFTQQMIYDIEIEKLSVSESEKGVVYAYNVAYKIYRNNGTFRNDIGSDGAKTLYFELLESNDSILIDRITYYT